MEQPTKGSFLEWLHRSPHALSFRDRDDLVTSAIRAHDEGVPVSVVCDDLLGLSSNIRTGRIPPLGTNGWLSAEATESIASYLQNVLSPHRNASSLPHSPKIDSYPLSRSTEKHYPKCPPLWDKLPSELISNIFLIGVRDERHEGRGESKKFNLTVSHVSRRWREISLSRGMMWQFFTMTDIDHEYSWTKSCLERCGTAPLDFKLAWTLAGPRATIRGQQDLVNQLDILFSCVCRWRDVSITVDRHATLLAFVERFEVVGHPLGRLESLRLNNRQLSFRRARSQDYLHIPPVALSPDIAPRLKSLTLATGHMSWDDLRFPELTRLELAYHASEILPSLDQFMAMLSASPNLTELILKGGSGPFKDQFSLSDVDSIKSMSLPSLRYLEFTDFRSAVQLSLLTKLIRAPHLESFHIEGFFEDRFDDCITTFGCPSRGYTMVKDLSLTSIEGTGSLAFTSIFAGMGNVEHLTLQCNAKPQNHTIYCLTPLPPHPSATSLNVIMPHLKTFQFASIPPAEVADMLEGRRNADYPVHRLLIQKEAKIPPPVMERLRNVVDNRIEYFELPICGDEDDVESESDSTEEDIEESTGDDSSGSENGE